jgi:hypothetical protein
MLAVAACEVTAGVDAHRHADAGRHGNHQGGERIGDQGDPERWLPRAKHMGQDAAAQAARPIHATARRLKPSVASTPASGTATVRGSSPPASTYASSGRYGCPCSRAARRARANASAVALTATTMPVSTRA